MRLILIAFIFCTVGCSSRSSGYDQLEQLQNVFGTANWRVVKGTDTSYIFFSPQVDKSIKTYQFNLLKGDSVHTKTGSIKLVNGKVEWSFFNRVWMLDHIGNNEMTWKDANQLKYILTRENDSSMQIKTPDGEWQFKRTLPLSTFLVRAKYDYEQGSKLADSGEVKPRK